VIPLYYQRDRDGFAARLDQAHETHHPHSGWRFTPTVW